METPITDLSLILLTRKYKSQASGFLLTLFFGGIGLFYSSFWGGLIIFIIEFITGFFMETHISEVNNSSYLLGYLGYGYSHEYGLGPYLLMLLVCRVLGLIISYTFIEEGNKEIDEAILEYQNKGKSEIN